MHAQRVGWSPKMLTLIGQWIAVKEKAIKNLLIGKTYNEENKYFNCKYFKQGKRKCFFGNKCSQSSQRATVRNFENIWGSRRSRSTLLFNFGTLLFNLGTLLLDLDFGKTEVDSDDDDDLPSDISEE